MRVEISTEVTYPPKLLEVSDKPGHLETPEPTWNVSDSIDSSVEAVVAAFLRGLADDFDPPVIPNSNRTTQAISNSRLRTRIQIWENPSGKDETLLTDLITAKSATIGATLRGTAESIMPNKKHMRD